MTFGDTIIILPSYALQTLHLNKLVGARAKIIETKYHGNEISGYWVALSKPYMGEKEWFIPIDSIGACN
jgi:hypothetical protein